MSTTLKERRERAGLTQIQVARSAGVTEKTIREIEQGRSNPRLATARALAAAVGCSVDELMPEATTA